LFIIGDDFGWNDVGYHGGEIPTQNMDFLAAEGLKLEAHYVLPGE
jgi:arylsulfatase A-like enzyme